ncbi:internal alternative NAD(P)H-ubiquinone oxidoreductase A2, mitochondrial-like [Corylus avellana]|uniref:internal alternative NAD(P)H-ubiquinone oxidoreductase A2, mitochondrial-like n=1 Tax=Corylus avellana TaxID=13451 RepID=UPI00286D41B7|nr:internal alternative NAD(P)H-ubiquinone oxidoreductase A2, mitochondrial-like [Corylus avellana]
MPSSIKSNWISVLVFSIGVDEWLLFPSVQDVFATADCGGFLESTRKPTLPALVQVAERQGKYLSHRLELVEVMPMEQMTWNWEIHLFTSI